MNSKKTDLKSHLKLTLPIGTECVVVGAMASAHDFIASHGKCEIGFEHTGSLYRIVSSYSYSYSYPPTPTPTPTPSPTPSATPSATSASPSASPSASTSASTSTSTSTTTTTTTTTSY